MRIRAKNKEADVADVVDEVRVKKRPCLVCREQFESAWAGERICRKCKSTAAWRSG
jgi:hypothetical protein